MAHSAIEVTCVAITARAPGATADELAHVTSAAVDVRRTYRTRMISTCDTLVRPTRARRTARPRRRRSLNVVADVPAVRWRSCASGQPDRRCRRTRAPRGALVTPDPRARSDARARFGPDSRGRAAPLTHAGLDPGREDAPLWTRRARGGHDPQPAAGRARTRSSGRRATTSVPQSRRPGADDADELSPWPRSRSAMSPENRRRCSRHRDEAAVGRRRRDRRSSCPGSAATRRSHGEVGVARQQADALLERAPRRAASSRSRRPPSQPVVAVERATVSRPLPSAAARNR